MMNADADSGDVVVDGFELSAFARVPRGFNDSRYSEFDQHCLQHVGDLIGKAAAEGEFSAEQGNALVKLPKQIVFGEPHEIGKADGNKFFRVSHLKLEPGSGRRGR